MPMAMMLLSWGWNARNVAAGGGGINVVIVCNQINTYTLSHQKTVMT